MNSRRFWSSGSRRLAILLLAVVVPPGLHPDGRRLAFTSGERVTEVWALENFLPRRP